MVSGNLFFKGRFEGWDVTVAEVGAGNVGASVVATKALQYCQPKVALFVGVAGGVKDVTIGDVVVATKVYGYESGKDSMTTFDVRPEVMETAHSLQQCARGLRQREKWKKRLDPKITYGAPRVFVGPIATGEKVVASKRAPTARLLKSHYGDALAVEMEGRGFLKAVHVSNQVEGCVVRGISDLLSGKANADKAGSQQRGADAASAVAFEILSMFGRGKVIDNRLEDNDQEESSFISNASNTMATSLDGLIFLECNKVISPSKILNREFIFVLNIRLVNLRSTDLGRVTGDREGNLLWQGAKTVQLCQVKNFGSINTSNIEIIFNVEFWTVKMMREGGCPDKKFSSYQHSVLVPPLRCHGIEPFEFYVVNNSPFYVNVLPNKNVNISLIGENNPKEANLIPSRFNEAFILDPSPMDFTSLHSGVDVPWVMMKCEDNNAMICNLGTDFLLWGIRIENFPMDMMAKPHLVPRHVFYGFSLDPIIRFALTDIGVNGIRRYSFEVYMTDVAQKRKFTGSFPLIIVVKENVPSAYFEIHGISGIVDGSW